MVVLRSACEFWLGFPFYTESGGKWLTAAANGGPNGNGWFGIAGGSKELHQDTPHLSVVKG